MKQIISFRDKPSLTSQCKWQTVISEFYSFTTFDLKRNLVKQYPYRLFYYLHLALRLANINSPFVQCLMLVLLYQTFGSYAQMGSMKNHCSCYKACDWKTPTYHLFTAWCWFCSARLLIATIRCRLRQKSFLVFVHLQQHDLLRVYDSLDPLQTQTNYKWFKSLTHAQTCNNLWINLNLQNEQIIEMMN